MTESNRTFAAGIIASAAVAFAEIAAAQTLPGEGKADNPSGTYYVRNASGAALNCAFRLPGAGWSPWFALMNNAQFTRSVRNRGETIQFFCAAPLERKAYELKPGERYALLPEPGRPAHLVRIAPR